MSSSSRRHKQLIIGGMICVVVVGALYVVSQTLNRSTPGVPASRAESGVTTTMIADRTRAAAPEMSWIRNAATELEDLRDRYENLETSVQTMVELHEAEKAQTAAEYDAILLRYEETINALQQRLEAGQGAAPQGTGFDVAGSDLASDFLAPGAVRPPVPGPLGPQGQPDNGAGGNMPTQTQTGGGVVSSGTPPAFEPVPFSRQFTLTSSGSSPGDDTRAIYLSNYLPAGSYAPAIVLSGVDASTSVTSQAEPVPVVFRITAPAVTAGTRSTHGHTIDLTGCTVTGSARGDLSSERVYVRLLKLSCVQSGGRVFETDVAGYMSGAGKAGARGLVVSREGRLINNAAIAGALGGLADGINSVGNAASGADATSFEDVLRSAGVASAASGASGAANRLSEYYIERAEQYQPVVSLYGGTQVELVFLEGVNLE
ncbi:conjugal transfer protein TraB [Roseobacter sp. HKCCD9010]|uniref:TrbI/VirB10 family protein n=1 Tax=unclassified Roseobacter TaxID=196798 RepID=UPI001491BAE4|nr:MULTISPECIES: TrbI/VirB10 family protein [unclassified Roseobacter]MBF9052272.1 conjugal transfer protein TraB [Rhodobacterales bacterium HKCCD4356]NNV14208.1 conjugal transfer protein TraB [Roseobacter sp. HKCCD7357]NNV18432.1 conjugal transfer protein TraB [Roseobacter sp. HKCCD8768]NNV27871.1 conjugal transfer protein TraB [Roseobacter sp. HKCCD8192]NNV32137.1 conjugal transfer protein TraB [Roseobacter sp. HKCCD9061]